MAPRGAQLPAALGLAVRLLLGFGLGLKAAPIRTLALPIGPGPGSCPPMHFQCSIGGYCVPPIWHCDGDKDCPDGSDEEECKMEPCTQGGQCPPPTGSPCSCDSISDCRDGIENLPNCSSQACPAGELQCSLGGTCIPHTWLCDGHPDCPDSSDEFDCGTEILQEAMSVTTPVTLESVTYLVNATVTFIKDQDSVQSGNRSVYGIIAAAVVLSVGLVAATLLVLSRLCAQGFLYPLGLLVSVKESLLLSLL